MSKKLLPVLFLIVIVAAFFLLWGATHPAAQPAADPVPVSSDPASETPPETVPEPVEGTAGKITPSAIRNTWISISKSTASTWASNLRSSTRNPRTW